MSSTFANVAMQDESTKLLQMNANTIWDYLMNQDIGLFNIYVKDKPIPSFYLKIQHLCDQCPIYYMNLNGITIRFPMVALLSTLGFILGMRGYFRFINLSTNLSISFLFYAGMNASALLLHSLVPFSSENRDLLVYIDIACTGVSGLFLGIALYSMLSQNLSHKMKIRSAKNGYPIILCIMIFLCVLPNVPYHEHFYAMGVLSVFMFAFIILGASLCKHVDIALVKMGIYSLMIVLSIVITTSLCPVLCPLTNNMFNLMVLSFAHSSIGFMIVYRCGLDFLKKNEKQKEN